MLLIVIKFLRVLLVGVIVGRRDISFLTKTSHKVGRTQSFSFFPFFPLCSTASLLLNALEMEGRVHKRVGFCQHE